MSYVPGEDRGQAALLPAAIGPAATGRPPYDPRDLLKPYVGGYLNEARSPGRLERENSRDALCGSLS